MTDELHDRLASALREALTIVGDHTASCSDLHHGPGDLHELHMNCPVEKRIQGGEVRIREALAEYDRAGDKSNPPEFPDSSPSCTWTEDEDGVNRG